MPSGYQITCANKNQSGIIVRVGGPGWALSHYNVIIRIIENQLRFHIFIGDDSFDIGVRGDGRDAYLVLEPEGKALHEVEGLKSC